MENTIETICSFRGDYSFLSNFYRCDILWEGIKYPSLEHAYQASKSSDMFVREGIADLKTAGEAKRAGRLIDKDRTEDWEQTKFIVMMLLLQVKFPNDLHNKLSTLLKFTDPVDLIEGNSWGDKLWGAVWDSEHEVWDGLNCLGNLLEARRQWLIDNWDR